MKYRKKPVVIEAVQWNGVEVSELTEWIREALDNGTVTRHADNVVIHTLEGDMLAEPNDFIIRGVHGELYPCKPEIFEKTYEAVEEPES